MSILNKEVELFLFDALKDYDFSIHTNYLPNGNENNLTQWRRSNSNSLQFYATSSYIGEYGEQTKTVEVCIDVDIIKNTLRIVSVEPIEKKDSHIANC